MSFIEHKTSRAFDIVKKERNLVDPVGDGCRMNADEARKEGWDEAADVAQAFDELDGIIPSKNNGFTILSTIMKHKT